MLLCVNFKFFMSVSTPGIYQVNIHHAVSAGDVLLTELLIAKADGEVNTPNEDGVALLHLASAHGHVEVVNILIQAGGEVNSQTTEGTNLSGTWLESGSTPLHLASKNGHVEVISALLAAGADKTLKDRWGEKPHDIAYREDCKNAL